jgi:hypothetical protein
MEIQNNMHYIKGKLVRVWLMDLEVLVSKMGHIFKVLLIKVNLKMGFLYLMIVVILLGILKTFKLQDKEYIKIFRMVIIMKGNGKRIYNMVMAYKNIQIKMNLMVILCMVPNLDKEYINLQMEKYMKEHFIMV